MDGLGGNPTAGKLGRQLRGGRGLMERSPLISIQNPERLGFKDGKHKSHSASIHWAYFNCNCTRKHTVVSIPDFQSAFFILNV